MTTTALTPVDVKLPKFDAMKRAVEAAFTVDEVKGYRDQARVFQAAAKIAGDTEAEDRCYEIRRRAEKRLGEIMHAQAKAGDMAKGGQPHQRRSTGGTNPPVAAPTLLEMGIDKDLAKDARALASVPQKQFDAAFKEGGRPSVADIAGKKKPPPAPERSAESQAALWTWGRILDFERNGALALKPADVGKAMSDFQAEDITRLGPKVIAWLTKLVSQAERKK